MTAPANSLCDRYPQCRCDTFCVDSEAVTLRTASEIEQERLADKRAKLAFAFGHPTPTDVRSAISNALSRPISHDECEAIRLAVRKLYENKNVVLVGGKR